MKRSQLEHILRAASAITGADRLVVIGSQSLLGQHAEPPPDLTASIEADIFTLRSPQDAELIDGSIGEASPFHQTFGYYAHGVGAETATLPSGWKDRLIPLSTANTAGAVGLCLEANDLAVSKLAAGREKDLEFVAALIRHRLAQAEIVRERLADTPIGDAVRVLCMNRLERLARPQS